LGIDAQGFISAVNANDPDIYILATNVRMSAKKAYDTDPGIILMLNRKKISVKDALGQSLVQPDTEVVTFKMKAKDAAKVCIDCTACEKICPLHLPLLKIIKDLKKDGKFSEM